MELVAKIFIAIKAVSTLNLREHWSTRAKRNASQRRSTRLKLPVYLDGPKVIVTLTRSGARSLDDDNLRGALKAYRDGVADWLRVDDASPLIKFEYAQMRGQEGVHIEVKTTTVQRQEGAFVQTQERLEDG